MAKGSTEKKFFKDGFIELPLIYYIIKPVTVNNSVVLVYSQISAANPQWILTFSVPP